MAYYRKNSLRLQNFDYGQPERYFVTLLVINRACLFGAIRNDIMTLSELGKIAENIWLSIPDHAPNVILDEYIIMPNHIHGIIELSNDRVGGEASRSSRKGAARCTPTEDSYNRKGGACSALTSSAPTVSSAPTNNVQNRMQSGSLSTIIRSYKSATTKRINELRHTPGVPLWQRSFYDNIIRNDEALRNIQRYIKNNPQNWKSDRQNLKLTP